MTNRCLKVLSTKLINTNYQQLRYFIFRRTGPMRGKPPGVAKTLKQRLEEINYKDPNLYFKVNIGFLYDKKKANDTSTQWTKQFLKNKNDKELEKKSLRGELFVDSDEVKRCWYKTLAPLHIKNISDHYGIFDDLYGDAYFYPIVPLDIKFNCVNEDFMTSVFNGNVIKPVDTKSPPSINYEAKNDSLWTMIMTTPDGNLSSPKNEYCHWLIANIPGNEIQKGEQLIDYLRPFPYRGMGYCRYIFVLYKQNKQLDLSEYKKDQPCLSLVERNWNTYNFYRKYEDDLTPAGLAFFQSDWDDSLTDFFHNKLEMKEPVFEYDFPKPYIAKEKWFPKKESFDEYLDMYRDPKDINKEFLLKKLKKTHPFYGPEKPFKYPNAQKIDRDVPTWLKERMIRERLHWGRINEID